MTSWRSYIFAGTCGHVLAIHREDGHTAWSTSLPDTGFGEVTLNIEGDDLFAASGGHVFLLDPTDGAIRWSNSLEGMGFETVHLALPPRSPSPDPDSTLA